MSNSLAGGLTSLDRDNSAPRLHPSNPRRSGAGSAVGLDRFAARKAPLGTHNESSRAGGPLAVHPHREPRCRVPARTISFPKSSPTPPAAGEAVESIRRLVISPCLVGGFGALVMMLALTIQTSQAQTADWISGVTVDVEANLDCYFGGSDSSSSSLSGTCGSIASGYACANGACDDCAFGSPCGWTACLQTAGLWCVTSDLLSMDGVFQLNWGGNEPLDMCDCPGTGQVTLVIDLTIGSPLATVEVSSSLSETASIQFESLGGGCATEVFSTSNSATWRLGAGSHRATLVLNVNSCSWMDWGTWSNVIECSSFSVALDILDSGSTPHDCNGNCVPDDEDISSETSLDTDGNGIPDECEVHADSVFAAPTGTSGNQFGRSVSINGSSLAVGAPLASTSVAAAGEAWIYGQSESDSNLWRSLARVRSSTPTDSGQFGIDLAVVGDRVVVGAIGEGANADGSGTGSGAVHVYQRTSATGGFIHVQRLAPAAASANQAYGFGVSADGDWLAVGAYNDDEGGQDAGAVFLYEWAQGVYEFRQKLLGSPSSANQKFGVDTAMHGATLVVGAYRDGGAGPVNAGAVFVFERDSAGVWSQTQVLRSNPVVPGAWFGGRVDVSASRILVAASVEANPGSVSGSAYVFVQDGSQWVQEDRLVVPAGGAGSWFGSSVTLSGATALVGANGASSAGVSSGSAYGFEPDQGNWSMVVPQPPQPPVAGSGYGFAIDRAGGVLLVGAPYGAGTVTLRQVISDCDGNGIDDDIEMDAGGDCDRDLVLDVCAIASGTVEDCNGNLVPDSCEIADGSAADVDGDGVPDECQSFTIRVPEDFATLQDAIDAVPAGSTDLWTIDVGPGTFAGGSTGGKNIAIVGDSMTTTVLAGDFFSPVVEAAWPSGLGTFELRDVTVRNGTYGALVLDYHTVVIERVRFQWCNTGMWIDGGWIYGASPNVSYCEAASCDHGFRISRCFRPTFEWCLAEDCEGGYLLEQNCGVPCGSGEREATTMTLCEARNNLGTGVRTDSYVTIDGGSFSGNGTGIKAGTAVFATSAVIEGNATGVHTGGQAWTLRTSLEDCSIGGNDVGLLVDDAESEWISGPQVSGCSFSENQTGIQSIRTSSSVASSGLEVSNCTFADTTAIYVRNTVPNNDWWTWLSVSGCSFEGGIPFDVQVQGGVRVSGSTVRSATECGTIDCQTHSAPLQIVGNQFENNALGLTLGWGDGGPINEVLWGKSQSAVSGNTCCGPGQPCLLGNFIDGGNTTLDCCSDPGPDSDGDGDPDCSDGCPSDPGKTSPGTCGCGVADTDSDSDGTPDCNDGCPNDPGKTSPGTCGCGVPESNLASWYPDIDGDGYGDASAEATLACSQPNGHVLSNDDCDDSDPAIYPGADEVCDDQIDNDCDGSVDEDCALLATFIGFDAETSIVEHAGEVFAVIDLFAAFEESSVQLVNVYDSEISNSLASHFSQFDYGGGTWIPSLCDPTTVAVDSFVTIGGEPGPAAGNTTSLDPAFGDGTAQTPPAGAGWYNSNPGNLQGLTDSGGTTWLGRFVKVATLAPETLTVTAWVTFASHPDGVVQQEVDTLEIEYPLRPCPGDLDGDGEVDGADLGIMLLHWGTSDQVSDLNGDGTVTGADIGVLLLHWGLCL